MEHITESTLKELILEVLNTTPEEAQKNAKTTAELRKETGLSDKKIRVLLADLINIGKVEPTTVMRKNIAGYWSVRPAYSLLVKS